MPSPDTAIPPASSLRGQFLVAMPEMTDSRFGESVIFMIEHAEAGAMGLMVNQDMPETNVGEILQDLDLGSPEELIALPDSVRERHVLVGGPVDTGRGFILHSRDYYREDNSLIVNTDTAMTATLEALKAITFGPGPKQSLFALGYCGWGAGQLEDELAANSWLTVPYSNDLLFSTPLEQRYDKALALLGVTRASLSSASGTA